MGDRIRKRALVVVLEGQIDFDSPDLLQVGKRGCYEAVMTLVDHSGDVSWAVITRARTIVAEGHSRHREVDRGRASARCGYHRNRSDQQQRAHAKAIHNFSK